MILESPMIIMGFGINPGGNSKIDFPIPLPWLLSHGNSKSTCRALAQTEHSLKKHESLKLNYQGSTKLEPFNPSLRV
ncbi:MAG: hypothetical protein COC08_04665 [Maribacter sp.]|nr:MAG: hypothetical protein COC08_04665 [Maribacter sp.]